MPQDYLSTYLKNLNHLSAQMNVAKIRSEGDIAVANIRSAHEMNLARFNANVAITEAEINGYNGTIQEVLRGNSAIGVEVARGRSELQCAVTNNIFSILNQSYSALLNEMAEERKHERAKELMELDAKLKIIERFVDLELDKEKLEHSVREKIIDDLIRQVLGLDGVGFSLDEIRQAVNKMMREAEPYTGY